MKSTRLFPSLLVAFFTWSCDSEGAGEVEPDATAEPPTCDLPQLFEKSPGASLEGAGWHRLYIQGAERGAGDDGRFSMSEHRSEIASGDHFLLNQGALVEFTHSVAQPLTGHVFVHIARTDDPEVVGRYELFLMHGDEAVQAFEIDDPVTGEMGYDPFERCVRVDASEPGIDGLMLRVTNLTGGMLGVVTRAPDYYTWIDLELE